MKDGFSACVAWAAICTVGTIHPGVVAAQERKDLPQATVELVVRSPEGREVANAKMESPPASISTHIKSALGPGDERCAGACSFLLAGRSATAERGG